MLTKLQLQLQLQPPAPSPQPPAPSPQPPAPSPQPQPTMLSLIQRVTSASVTVDGDTLGAIGPGLLALVGVEPGDGDAQVERMKARLLGYRGFRSEESRVGKECAQSGRTWWAAVA